MWRRRLRNTSSIAAPALALRWKRSAHLDYRRRFLAAALGERTSAVADDDLDAGVCAQPIGEHLGSAVVEQVNRPMRFQIEQQGPIPTLLFSQRHVIDTEHSRSTLVTFVG